MKEYLLLIVLLSFCSSTKCQLAATERTSRYSMGLSYCPAVTFRSIRYTSDQEYLQSLKNHMETPMYGFMASIAVQRHFGKKGTVELGVSFSGMGYKTKETNLIWEPANPQFPTATWSAFSYQYISLAARYKYILGGKKLQYYILPGFSIDVLLQRKARVYSSFADASSQKSISATRGGFSSPNFSILIAVGAQVNLSNRFAICLEPTYKRGLVSVIPDSDNHEYLYAFGLNTQLIYHFKK